MSKEKNDSQLTFDFDDFSDDAAHSSRGNHRPNRKRMDDMIPGLFDSEASSEEEEMEEFLREIHPGTSPAAEPAAAPDAPPASEPDCISGSAGKSVSAADSIPAEKTSSPANESAVLNRQKMKRAALAFLASLNPSGAALDVSVSGLRAKAAAAAFWLEGGEVVRTAAAEIRIADDAAIETAGNAEQFAQLKLARQEREMLEQEIRRREPELRDGSTLFCEFEQWNYNDSSNPAYRQCLRRIRKLEHAVFHGSRLERFRSAGVASELYLIVPENSVSPEALADGWGLVYIRPDLTCQLIRKPERCDVPAEKRTRLALNISAAGMADILFSHGVRIAADGTALAGPLPRKRRSLKSVSS